MYGLYGFITTWWLYILSKSIMVKDKVIVCFKEGVLWQASAISLFWSEVAEIFYEQQSPLLAVGRPDRQAIKEQKGNRQHMYLYTMYICRFVLTYKVAGNIEQVGIKR